MTRLVSFIVALAVLTSTVAPVAAHARTTMVPGEVCLMLSHHPSGGPAVSEPCPCHRDDSDGSSLRDGVNLMLPEPLAAVPAAPPATGVTPVPQALRRPGFAVPLDHPPDLRS